MYSVLSIHMFVVPSNNVFSLPDELDYKKVLDSRIDEIEEISQDVRRFRDSRLPDRPPPTTADSVLAKGDFAIRF